MRITDLIDKRSICLDGTLHTKAEALDQMVALMTASGKIADEEGYRKQVYLREEESTTGIGGGIAIPHGKCSAVREPGLAAMVVRDGVEFESLDGMPAHLIFLIAAPDTEDNIHLDVLSKLSVLLMDQSFVEKLTKAETAEEFLAVIDQADQENQTLTASWPLRMGSRKTALLFLKRQKLPKPKPPAAFWQSPPAPPALPTPIWPQRDWKRPPGPPDAL